ncbi:hypothetical protein IWX90DRAFT_139082 [Phyllosticta citrichinensis]|uniref:Secreted protein n=1 Tax=Phyllosticta citrichinensis TaxID=1130410 RepID=A0ABR1XYV0_9PEZI
MMPCVVALAPHHPLPHILILLLLLLLLCFPAPSRDHFVLLQVYTEEEEEACSAPSLARSPHMYVRTHNGPPHRTRLVRRSNRPSIHSAAMPSHLDQPHHTKQMKLCSYMHGHSWFRHAHSLHPSYSSSSSSSSSYDEAASRKSVRRVHRLQRPAVLRCAVPRYTVPRPFCVSVYSTGIHVHVLRWHD